MMVQPMGWKIPRHSETDVRSLPMRLTAAGVRIYIYIQYACAPLNVVAHVDACEHVRLCMCMCTRLHECNECANVTVCVPHV